MSVSKCLFFTAGLALIFALGCRAEGSRVADHWGEAFYANNELMIVDPNAGRDADNGSIDFEGNTVENVMDRYRRGQVARQSRNLPTSILDQASSSRAK